LSPTGRLELVEEDRSIRQSILLLLSTLPGERIMRPDYGCALQRLVFSPNDDTTAGLAMHHVRQAVKRWERRIEVIGLDAGRSAVDPGKLEIVLSYRIRSTRGEDRLTASLDVRGEPA
jgi:uncharacterized protein